VSEFKPNGCGPKGGIIRPPYSVFFEASCNRHDLSYHKGGSSKDRLRADKGFYHAMLRDCDRASPAIKRAYYRSWSLAYYMAVRSFGWMFFSFK
jgi:hypothetical protein